MEAVPADGVTLGEVLLRGGEDARGDAYCQSFETLAFFFAVSSRALAFEHTKVDPALRLICVEWPSLCWFSREASYLL